jgi:hypothetical protein
LLLDSNNYFKIDSSLLKFDSINHHTFYKFAKSKYFDASFYDTLVSPYLKGDFVFETWGRSGLEGPVCDKYSVVSNLELYMN